MTHITKVGLLVGTLLLSACTGGQPQVRPQPAPAPIVQEPVEAAPVVSDTYRIAMLLPLSGPSKDIGQAALNGATMGFYELYSPKDVELELYDTRGTVDGARQAAETALQDNANIIVGPVFSANVAEVADIVTPQGLQVLALSNDKLAARENVKVLGPHLEAEVERLLQLAIEHRSQSVLLFAPQNGYGYRLEQEFDRLMEDENDLVFKTVLFPDQANVDELTQLISDTGSYEARTRQLQDILDLFEARYKATQDASKALTEAVDRTDLTQRWVESYPFSCEPPKRPEEAQLTSAGGTLKADGTYALNPSPTPLLEPTQKAQAYAHTRPCKIDVASFADDLARDYALEREAETLALDASPVDTPLEPEIPAKDLAEDQTAIDVPNVVTKDDMLSPETLQALMDSTPEPPSAEEAWAERLKTELEDAQFTLLDDMAVCLGFMAEKNYDQDRGVETLVRSLAKREVLGPPEFDTVILPLAGDQLRIVSSLFDFYHVGPPRVRFFGDSQWDKIERLYEEPSLRQAKWLSVARPFSAPGRARYEASFQDPPGYISAIAFDAVHVAFDQSHPQSVPKAPPGSDGYMMGESGAFRINEDGTNERVISVKTLHGQEKTDADKTKPEALNRKASGPEFGEDREMYLKRTCLGLY